MTFARDDTNNKCREDQAWHKDRCCHQQRIHRSPAMVDPALRALIHPTGLDAYTQRIFGFSGTTNKCRVRIAHADFQRGMKRVRGAHPSTVRILRCHSRVGGNPYDTSLRDERASLKAEYSACAQWIPAYAGMTTRIGQIILPMGMPVEAMARGQPLSMRLSRHALPGRGGLGPAKRDAASGKATKKCRVDQAERIHHSSIPVASTHSALINPTVQTAKRRNRLVTLNGWARAVFGSEILEPESMHRRANRFQFALTP